MVAYNLAILYTHQYLVVVMEVAVAVLLAQSFSFFLSSSSSADVDGVAVDLQVVTDSVTLVEIADVNHLFRNLSSKSIAPIHTYLYGKCHDIQNHKQIQGGKPKCVTELD